MSTQLIPREDWSSFLTAFSGQHEGWLVTLEVLSRQAGAQVKAREMALSSITVEPRHRDTKQISIVLGVPEHIRHPVREPESVELHETTMGAHESLEIKSSDGTATILRFRSAVPAEQVDGIVQ